MDDTLRVEGPEPMLCNTALSVRCAPPQRLPTPRRQGRKIGPGFTNEDGHSVNTLSASPDPLTKFRNMAHLRNSAAPNPAILPMAPLQPESAPMPEDRKSLGAGLANEGAAHFVFQTRVKHPSCAMLASCFAMVAGVTSHAGYFVSHFVAWMQNTIVTALAGNAIPVAPAVPLIVSVPAAYSCPAVAAAAATKQPDGTFTAARIDVGRGDVVP
jgi:hypothetical protein